MAHLIRMPRAVWRRQPQGIVGLSNAFSDSSFVYSPAVSVEQISRVSSETYRSGVVRMASDAGIVERISTTGGSGNYLSFASSEAMNLPSAGHTLLLLARMLADSSASYDRIWTRDIATTVPNNSYGFLFTPPTDPQPNRVYFATKSNLGVSHNIGYTTANSEARRDKHVLYALVYNGTSGTFYNDGVAVSSASYTSAAASSLAMFIGDPTTPVSDSGAPASVGLIAIIPRALHPAHIKSLSENPWQLFKPRPSRFILIPSSSGATYNLIGAINSLSSTSNASVLVARALSTALASDSLTPSAALLVYRRMVSTPDSQSSTPAIAVNVARALVSALSSDSTSATANANVVRAIATALTSATTTPDTVTLNTSTVIALVTAVVSGSLTPDAALAVARALSTALNSDSTTSGAAVSVLRPQVTALSSQSTTSNAALDLLALLQIATSITSASSTADASMTLARAIASSVASISTTASPSLAVLRKLATALASASAVSAPNLLLGGDTIIAIQSLIASQSLTPDRVRLLTELVAAIDSALRLRATATRPEMSGIGSKSSATATGLPVSMATTISTN